MSNEKTGSVRGQGWGLIAVGIAAPLLGLLLLQVSPGTWTAVPALLSFFPIGPGLIVMGVIVLIRKKRFR